MRQKIAFEEAGTYKGFDYYVLALESGHRCGYVKIRESSELFGKEYDEISSIEVHGGLTYSNKYLGKLQGWFIGFDCAHIDDKKDKSIMSEKFKSLYENYDYFEDNYATIKDTEFVESECKKLIDQICLK